MLTQLLIEQFAIVERLEISFDSGLCLLTGETGAGKSLVIAALSAVSGGRVSLDQVRQGAKQAYLEATFVPSAESPVWAALTENSIETDGSVVLTRVISPRGSRCRINGEQVTQSVLNQIGGLLIDIVGQHEHQSLMRIERHLSLLDGLGDRGHRSRLQRLSEGHGLWREAQRRLQVLETAQQEQTRQLDFWQFQLEEIRGAGIDPTEEDSLRTERDLLANATQLQESLGGVAEILGGDEGIMRGLQMALQQLRMAARQADAFQGLADQVAEAEVLISDAGREIHRRIDSLEANPDRLSEITDRLDVLTRLKRKYGETLPEVVAFADDLASKLDQMEAATGEIGELREAVQLGEQELGKLAMQASHARKELALELEESVMTELADLGMAKCAFHVAMRLRPLTEHGLDEVEFHISPNPGEPLRPLARIASGGEMSRLTLALKIVLRQSDPIATLIFDEVDSGISGGAARSVAEKLAALSNDVQVLCITHLPTVAAMADQHLRLQKLAGSAQTAVHVVDLAQKERIEELAYMATGTTSDIALKQAVDLYRQAAAFKKKGRG
ncbi:MAG: DNA repair protein RecN [Candidatus Sericytochromatia bacterium]|nr:DNA repair protein RecN [Candidatus Sericytochromatia bacterium]